MCGITGLISFTDKGNEKLSFTKNAIQKLNLRGPDHQAVFEKNSISFGHARLSIIDTSSSANQPFIDSSGNYTIVFNGEIYNYKEIKKELSDLGVIFSTNSDTEVLLELFKLKGKKCLEQLNGFFAFALYNHLDGSVFIARDRMGIKPLIYYKTEDYFAFASEHKALIEYKFPKKINQEALELYFQYNYIPAPLSIFEGVQKLMPGESITIKGNSINFNKYYSPKINKKSYAKFEYKQAQNKLEELLHESVKKRMIADVPLGTFLSGGIDSSVISTIASEYTSNLKTFSIGYKDEPMYDETKYALAVADKIKSNHTTFSLTNDDLLNDVDNVLNYLDEPFADSSAIAVYILSKRTKNEVTVSLSGDGADELFSGYNKHLADFLCRNKGIKNKIIKTGKPLFFALPKSRGSKIGNLNRKLFKFSEGLNLNNGDRYVRWAKFSQPKNVSQLLKNKIKNIDYKSDEILRKQLSDSDFNNYLLNDVNHVLVNDMLPKVDYMSMANSLEVRTPFLDHNIVDFAFSIPTEYKINKNIKKRILQDTFRDKLPELLYTRPKHGFEVPLAKWFNNELKSKINELTKQDLIEEQGIFEYEFIQDLKAKVNSKNPEDSPFMLWALVVFQSWYTKYFE